MRVAVAFFSMIGVVAACAKHDDLAYHPSGSSSASAGGGGAGGEADASSAASTGVGAGEGGADAGPPGPSKLTIVNGIADYDAVRICFLPFPAGDPGAAPWPADAKGIAFARAIVVDPIDSAIPPNTDIQPVAIGGDLAAAAGKTCGEIIAMSGADTGPVISTATLPILPGAAFTSHKSLLVATTGCIGGPGHDGQNATLGCGMGYSPATPTASLFAAGMSRVSDPKRVALQIAIADVAWPESAVTITPGLSNAMDVLVAMTLTNGAITPQFDMLGVADYGMLDKVVLKNFIPNQMVPSSAVALSGVFANGNLDASKFVNGSHLVLVGVGAYPGIPAGSFFHAFTYALIDSDP